MNLYGIEFTKLEDYFLSIDSKKFHAKQLFQWLYQKKISNLDEITDRAGYAQGIRPIVTLKSEVVTTGTSNNGYNIDIVK